jgi:phosphomecalonate degydratase large subunit
MRLTDEEKKMLDGQYGPSVRKSMEILVALGDIYDAEQMVPVASTHMPGSSIVVAGEAGLRFVEEMSEHVGRLAAFTTLNPSAMDRAQWKELSLREEEVEPQFRLTRAYEKMGAISCHTCTPYFIGNIPRLGEHVAWGESSAVAYANSVLGARTNREGGPSALASAVTGRTPAYGYHLDSNRKGHLLVKVTRPIKGFFDYGNLGYHVGAIAGDRVPVFLGISPRATPDELKILGAALASSGAVALYHAVGVTPEARTLEEAFGGAPRGESLEIGDQELAQAAQKLNKAKTSTVDWVFLGCPHISIQEFGEIAALLEGKRLHNGVDLWVSSSPATKALSDIMGYSEIIEATGARIVCETCPVLALTGSIAERKGFTCITTNSAKMAHYMPGQFNILSHYGSLSQCIEAAMSGQWR